MAYRGPDGFAWWSREDAALGHGALRLHANAPSSLGVHALPDGRICVVDGYVGNPRELADGLGLPPTFLPMDDGSLLALAVQKWGHGLHEYAIGEYAIAVWQPDGRCLELFNDRLGGRPICYVQTPSLFAFASDSLALLALPGVSRKMDELGIVSIWFSDAVYGSLDRTAFENIRQLPPAHRLRREFAGRIQIDRYWSLSPQEPLQLKDERDYVEAFKEIFSTAVDSSMQGAPRSALMLSGGIDSGAILASRLGYHSGGKADDLMCISAVLSGQIQDAAAVAEDRNIRTVTSGQPQVRQFEVPPGHSDAGVDSADLAQVAWSWMHPLDISLIVPSLVYRFASSEGCRIVLDGVEGDVVTSAPVHYLSGLLRDGDVLGAWRESAFAPRVHTYLRGSSKLGLLHRGLMAAIEPAWSRRVRGHWHARREFAEALRHPVMAPGLARRTGLAHRLEAVARLRARRDPQFRCDNMSYWMAFAQRGFNNVAARHGVEARHPWCDRRVVDFFLKLPLSLRVRNGWTKYVVRQACEPALGADVAWHYGKAHLGAYLARPALEDAAPYLAKLLRQHRELLQPHVREDLITKSVRALEQGALENAEFCDTILTITSLAGWLNHVHQHCPGNDLGPYRCCSATQNPV